ncbi:MAG: hypothetical protein DSY80_09585 [Desulfocapsa sp.]|nr:MAG: hypothetical protein DSY80_09585 [Desulfocapsa sp.]
MTDGQKLVTFIDSMMVGDNPFKTDISIKKDVTEAEMKKNCATYSCKECPLLKRCSMAEVLYSMTKDSMTSRA